MCSLAFNKHVSQNVFHILNVLHLLILRLPFAKETLYLVILRICGHCLKTGDILVCKKTTTKYVCYVIIQRKREVFQNFLSTHTEIEMEERQRKM